MGLFSETKTQVGTQVQRAIEDEQLPDSVRNGVTKNLFDADSGGDQMVEYILEDMISSMAVRANRMYNYGKDDYIFGLPESSYHSSLDGKNKAKAYLDSVHGGTGSFTYYKYGPANLLHMGYMALMDQEGWNPVTNLLPALSATKETDVYMADLQVFVVEATNTEITNGSLEEWGPPSASYPNPVTQMASQAFGKLQSKKGFQTDASASKDYLLLTYAWEEEITIPPPEDSPEGTLPTKKKLVKSDSMRIELPEYSIESDYHQARYVTSQGEIIYWMYEPGNGVETLDTVFSMAYSGTGTFFPWAYFRFNKQSTVDDTNSDEFKSTKKLLKHIGIDLKTVGDGINSNPDIADVEQAMLVMGVPPDSTNEIDRRYLFDFFDMIQINTIDHENNTSNPIQTQIKRALGNEVADTGIIIQDKRFKMSFAFTDIHKKGVGGSIGSIGTYTSEVGSGVHIYRHQVTETVYEEITVKGLKMTYFIYGNYTTTGDENNKSILLVPVDVNIANMYSIPVREKLYSRSLHYVFNSRTVTKLKWYQTGIFRAIMVIIAIVITVLSWGSTWQSIGVALGAGATATTILIMILTELAIQIAIIVAAKLFVKVVGVKVAFIAAVVAAIAGVYVNYGSGVAGAPWGNQLLTASTSLTKAVNSSLQDDFNDLLADQSVFQKEMDAQMKTLEDAKALLNGTSQLDPFIVFGETPNDFYQRTVHSGNIGTVGIDVVSSFVDISLQLPKLSDTV